MPTATRIVPRLVVDGADAALAFYQAVFGLTLRACHRTPDGRVVHAELAAGDAAAVFVKDADEYDPAATARETPVLLSVDTDDVDTMFAEAVARGAEVIFPLADQFYGERGGRLRDPFGQVWMLSTRIEEVSAEEMDRRLAAWSASS